MATYSHHAARRAADALKAGEAVTLGALHFMAAEAWPAGENPHALLISASRAQFLGLGGRALHVVTAQADEAHALLFALASPKPLNARPATAEEECALALLKVAGCLPSAVFPVHVQNDALYVSAQEVREYLAAEEPFSALPPVRLPLHGAEEARVVGFYGGHMALLIGHPERQDAPLARLHSSCVTGDVLGSLRCDCGSQLRGALDAMIAQGAGVLLYLNQEGRSIGLEAKLRAYRLQEQGVDTVDANRALGYADDERDFSLAARMLHVIGIVRVRLLTNNPAKIEALTKHGIEVRERVPLAIAPGAHNAEYLDAKRLKMRHEF